jgi:[ribosomal protein S18]-alanine N-acetyltransferase
VEIRPAVSSDLDQLVALERLAFGASAYSPATFRQFLDLSGELFPVAWSTSGLLGYALAARSLEPSVAWFLSAAVSPAHRGRGLGRSLGAHMIDRCRAHGLSVIRGTVAPGNGPSLHVLRSLGFIEIGFDPDYFGPGQGRLIVELREPSSPHPGTPP